MNARQLSTLQVKNGHLNVLLCFWFHQAPEITSLHTRVSYSGAVGLQNNSRSNPFNRSISSTIVHPFATNSAVVHLQHGRLEEQERIKQRAATVIQAGWRGRIGRINGRAHSKVRGTGEHHFGENTESNNDGSKVEVVPVLVWIPAPLVLPPTHPLVSTRLNELHSAKRGDSERETTQSGKPCGTRLSTWG